MPHLLCHLSFKYLPDGVVKRLALTAWNSHWLSQRKLLLPALYPEMSNPHQPALPLFKQCSVLTFPFSHTPCEEKHRVLLSLLLTIKSELSLWVHCQTALWVSLSCCLTPHWTLQPPEAIIDSVFLHKMSMWDLCFISGPELLLY